MTCDHLDQKDVAHFLEIFNKLSEFEAQQRFLRGHGAFHESELPVPEVVRVLKWLKDYGTERSAPRSAPTEEQLNGDSATARRLCDVYKRVNAGPTRNWALLEILNILIIDARQRKSV